MLFRRLRRPPSALLRREEGEEAVVPKPHPDGLDDTGSDRVPVSRDRTRRAIAVATRRSRTLQPQDKEREERPCRPPPERQEWAKRPVEVVGKGRFGGCVVYKTSLSTGPEEGDSAAVPVAVKAFSSKEAFLNEREAYEVMQSSLVEAETLLGGPSPLFLRFFGSKECVALEDGVELRYVTVTSLSEVGSLEDYLSRNTVTWPTLCKLLTSISKGLSCLHSGFGKSPKMSICHRNLSSRHILVNADLSCCISNFSHSSLVTSSCHGGGQSKVRNMGNAGVGDGHLKDDHQATPAEPPKVPTMPMTPRYLAPELLMEQDATDTFSERLGDFRPTMLQADVYAMSLIFWETSRRCRDLYQGMAVPDYELPYSRELMGRFAKTGRRSQLEWHQQRRHQQQTTGPLEPVPSGDTSRVDEEAADGLQQRHLEPTVEQMRVVVARQKARPLFPQIWKNSNPAVQQLRATVEESWDHDGEARLTSHCVVERVQELCSLWNRYKAMQQKKQAIVPPRVRNNAAAAENFATKPQVVTLKSTSVRMEVNQWSQPPASSSSRFIDLNRKIKVNNEVSLQQAVLPIQPYQGRNPCSERNLVSSPISGNEGLKDYSNSFLASAVLRSIKDRRPLPFQVGVPHHVSGDDEDELDWDEDSALGVRAVLDRLRRRRRGLQTAMPRNVPRPISYIRNDLGGSSFSSDPPLLLQQP